MSDYFLWAPGHDVAKASLIRVNPQPRCPGMKATERTWGLSGSVFEQGAYTEWFLDVLEEPVDYQALLAQINLSSSLNAPVTVWTLDETENFARFNANVARPQIGTDGQLDQGFLKGFLFLFTNLVRLA